MVYQVWPASYKDSNGDGIGDIPGIISSLDYLKDIGIDVLWLSPMHKGPQHDMGYDISDYQAIYEKYGTMEDMDQLIDGCHKRGIKILTDLVVNHTSDEHSWFIESRSSKTNPKRDWYFWRPAKYDSQGQRHPPNNWRALFGGSAWKWDETTQEYYLHLFAPEQPDLNWENPETRKAIYEDATNFWLRKGCDGFRIDTVNLYSKVTSFPDAPVVDPGTPWQPAGQFYVAGPRIHEFIHEMHENTFAHFDCMTVGECPGVHDPKEVNKYVGESRKELSMVFQFDLVNVGQTPSDKFRLAPYDLKDIKKICDGIHKVIEGTDGWSTSFIENHDQGRSVSRFLSDLPEYRVESSKLVATWIGTMSGTMFVYQGQEIGMVNIPKNWEPEEYKDVESSNFYKEMQKRYNNDPKVMKEVMKGLQVMARDNARTPVQWDDSPNAGFTTGTPWMRVNDSYKDINVKNEVNDPNSQLSHWKKVIALRKKYEDLFVYGEFQVQDWENRNVFTYTKESNRQKAVVFLNFSDQKQPFAMPPTVHGNATLVLASGDTKSDSELSPYESRVYIVG